MNDLTVCYEDRWIADTTWTNDRDRFIYRTFRHILQNATHFAGLSAVYLQKENDFKLGGTWCCCCIPAATEGAIQKVTDIMAFGITEPTLYNMM